MSDNGEQTSADDARRIIYGDDPANWPAADAEDPQPQHLGARRDARCPHCGSATLNPGHADTAAGRFCRSCRQYENLADAR